MRPGAPCSKELTAESHPDLACEQTGALDLEAWASHRPPLSRGVRARVAVDTRRLTRPDQTWSATVASMAVRSVMVNIQEAKTQLSRLVDRARGR
jgi:hypothetical protein